MSQTPLLIALGTVFIICHIYAIQAEPDNMLSQAEVSQLVKEERPKFIQKRRVKGNPEVRKAVRLLTTVFKQRAMQTEPSYMLSKAEFTQLMKDGLPNLQGSGKLKDIYGLFNQLDQNGDGQLSWSEFITPVKEVLARYYRKLYHG